MPVIIEFSRCIGTYPSAKFESIIYEHVNSEGMISSEDPVYYEYDFINNQLIESTKETFVNLYWDFILSKFNPEDNLYYNYEDGDLIVKNYRNQVVDKVKVKIDLPDFHSVDTIGHNITIDKIEGESVIFKVHVGFKSKYIPGQIISSGNPNNVYSVRVNKNTGEMLDYVQEQKQH